MSKEISMNCLWVDESFMERFCVSFEKLVNYDLNEVILDWGFYEYGIMGKKYN